MAKSDGLFLRTAKFEHAWAIPLCKKNFSFTLNTNRALSPSVRLFRVAPRLWSGVSGILFGFEVLIGVLWSIRFGGIIGRGGDISSASFTALVAILTFSFRLFGKQVDEKFDIEQFIRLN